MIGRRRLAVAVLDMNVAMSMVTTEAMMMMSIGLKLSNGIAFTIVLERPVCSIAPPSAKPPEMSQSTSQESVLRSLAVMTPVATKTATGMRATTVDGMPWSLPVIQSRIVPAKIT